MYIKCELFLNGTRFLYETFCTLTTLLMLSDTLLGFHLEFSYLDVFF